MRNLGQSSAETGTTLTKVEDSLVSRRPSTPNPAASFLFDSFSDVRPAGNVIGTIENGVTRRGVDVERQIAIDNGALRFQPLITPGWGRQGIAYGPFHRTQGLTLAVSITNGHNTSQGGSIPDSFIRRVRRWLLGPNADPWPRRLAAWITLPRRRLTLRRFYWWMRSSPTVYRLPRFNENLAIGWFTSEAPINPLVDGCGLIIHAAEGENGELWARVGTRCLSAFRRLKNLQVFYFVSLREQGAIYYAASIAGAHGLAAIPLMRPIAIDPFNNDQILYAGVHQCALGQIGFRVDTRVYGVQIERMPELTLEFGTAHAYDPLTVSSPPANTDELGGIWHTSYGRVRLTPKGATVPGDTAFSFIDPQSPSGLIHVLMETGASPGVAGIVWRLRDDGNYWLIKLSEKGCELVLVERGQAVAIAIDQLHRLKPDTTHSVQILDGYGQFGCYLDGERLFDAWFVNDALASATGMGIRFDRAGDIWIRDLEAHPREVPIPKNLRFTTPWTGLGTHVAYSENFEGPPGELAGRTLKIGAAAWEKTHGSGSIDLDGSGLAKVRATVDRPHPNRTFHTLPWNSADLADLEIAITPPGTGRGEKQCCRVGLVLWQDDANYLSVTTWLDDVHDGASISVFTKSRGFEELYDAIWTNVSDKVYWGKSFRLRIACDGEHFNIFVDDEPIMQRALIDIYPDDPPLNVHRVGIAINWEWGNDTGSIINGFVARK